jgi:FkbM family methyltransferase
MNIIQEIPFLWHQRRLLLSRERSLVLPFGENKMAIRPLSYDIYVVTEVFWEQVYSPRAVQIHAPAVVVDLGANIGAFSLWAARRWQPGLIVAVEMDEQNYVLFEENMRLNRLESNVRLVKAAIWDCNERVGIRRHGFNHGMNQACADSTGAGIPAITLERLLEMTGVEKVDVMKMDIEGAEGKLFSSANERILAGSVGCLLAELHPTRGASVEKIVRLLDRIGFEVHLRPQPFRTTPMLEAVNLRCGFGYRS